MNSGEKSHKTSQDCTSGTVPQRECVNYEEAMKYLDNVKKEFANDLERYTKFLDIMKDFKANHIDTPGVIQRVSLLFHDHPDLIVNFNTFLPNGFHVTYIGDKLCIINPKNEYEHVNPPEEQEPPVQVQPTPSEEKTKVEEEHMEVEVKESSSAESNDGEQNYQKKEWEFVSKIKQRFENNPIIYRKFLDSLHFLMRTPPSSPAPTSPHRKDSIVDDILCLNTEQKFMFVFQVVKKLFQGHDDLLEEFQNYLPTFAKERSDKDNSENMDSDEQEEDDDEHDDEESEDDEESDIGSTSSEGSLSGLSLYDGEPKENVVKRRKKMKELRKMAMKEAIQKARLKDRSPNAEIFNLLCNANLDLYKRIQRKLSKNELDRLFIFLNLYLRKNITSSELTASLRNSFSWRNKDIIEEICILFCNDYDSDSSKSDDDYEISQSVYRRNWIRDGDQVIRDIANKTICTLGVSYRHIKKDNKEAARPSGRTSLCDEVLNDTWTSYPSWSSEDNGNISSKKSSYEEFLYKTEDERFELDIVLDVNKYAIENFVLLKRKMDHMTEYERCRFKLDEKLNCTSGALITRAIRRVYGEAASKIINGLRETPYIAVPKVLQRLMDKEKEWRQAQVVMNKMWREQLEKNITRSLDYQAQNAKVADSRLLKTRAMINSIEQFFDYRQSKSQSNDIGPHLIINYPERRRIMHDVNDLMLHYLKRQTGFSKEDKRRMKFILRKILMEWVCEKHEDMSDDEREEDIELEKKKPKKDGEIDKLEYDSSGKKINFLNFYADNETDEWPIEEKVNAANAKKFFLRQATSHRRLFYGDDTLFVFMRYHQALCDRLGRIHSAYIRLVDEYYHQQKIKADWEREMETASKCSLLNIERNWGELGDAIRSIRNVGPSPTTYYNWIMSEMKRYLDGEMDASTYEESIRSIFPTEACYVFQIDKIISVGVRHLAILACNEDDCKAIKMYIRYRLRTPPTIYCSNNFVKKIEAEYAEVAEERLHGKNCFKFEYTNHVEPALAITLVDTEDTDGENDEVEETVASGAESVLMCDDRPSTSNCLPDTEKSEKQNQEVSAKKSRRKNVRGENFNMTKSLLKRTIKYKPPSNLLVFPWCSFKDYSHVPMSSERGGFYTRRPLKQQRLEMMKRMRLIRLDRSRTVSFEKSNRPSQGNVLEYSTIKTTACHPNFQFLKFNRYRCDPPL